MKASTADARSTLEVSATQALSIYFTAPATSPVTASTRLPLIPSSRPFAFRTFSVSTHGSTIYNPAPFSSRLPASTTSTVTSTITPWVQ